MSSYNSTKTDIKYIINDFYNGRFTIAECLELCSKYINGYTCFMFDNEKERTQNKLYAYAMEKINNVIKYRQQFTGEYIVFINCSSHDFIGDIIAGKKLFETRTKDTLHCLVGKRVYLCETGKGKRLVRCTAIIKEVITVKDEHTWNMYRDSLSIEPSSEYDWKEGTKVKYLYRLESVVSCFKPFKPVEGTMHGYVFMDYMGRKV